MDVVDVHDGERAVFRFEQRGLCGEVRLGCAVEVEVVEPEVREDRHIEHHAVDAVQDDDSFSADRFVTDRSVDVHIVSLRRKLGSCGSYIQTVRGVGYRLQDA